MQRWFSGTTGDGSQAGCAYGGGSSDGVYRSDRVGPCVGAGAGSRDGASGAPADRFLPTPPADGAGRGDSQAQSGVSAPLWLALDASEPDPWLALGQRALSMDRAQVPGALRAAGDTPAGRAVLIDYARTHGLRTLVASLQGADLGGSSLGQRGPEDDDAHATPDWLLERHPHLRDVHAAMREHRASGRVARCCAGCGGVLSVVSLPGRLVLSCPCGRCHTRFRLRSGA